jgi:hypothetical protein
MFRLVTGDLAGAQRDIAVALPIGERQFAPDYLPLGHLYYNAARIAAAAGDRSAARRHGRAALGVYDRADEVEPDRRERVVALLREVGGD